MWFSTLGGGAVSVEARSRPIGSTYAKGRTARQLRFTVLRGPDDV